VQDHPCPGPCFPEGRALAKALHGHLPRDRAMERRHRVLVIRTLPRKRRHGKKVTGTLSRDVATVLLSRGRVTAFVVGPCHRDLVAGFLSQGPLPLGPSQWDRAIGTLPRGPRHRVRVTGPCHGTLPSGPVTRALGPCYGTSFRGPSRHRFLSEGLVVGTMSQGPCHRDASRRRLSRVTWTVLTRHATEEPGPRLLGGTQSASRRRSPRRACPRAAQRAQRPPRAA
jgi:hypothetical protein